MAVQIYKPMKPLNKVIGKFMSDAETQLMENYSTQYIWPSEVYPGYAAVNEYRKKHGGWYSTGEGERSIGTRVVSAAGPSTVTVLFHWNDYLDYVDRGVGAGRPSGSIERGKTAKFQNRYIGAWSTKGGQKATHRPALFMETRHVERRIQNYLEDFYGWEGSMRMLKAFDNLRFDFDFG